MSWRDEDEADAAQDGSGPEGEEEGTTDSGDEPEARTGYGRWEEDAADDPGGGAAPGTGPEEARGGDPDPEGAGRVPRGTCELCGGPTIERHCKIQCLRCGYQRDCSDP